MKTFKVVNGSQLVDFVFPAVAQAGKQITVPADSTAYVDCEAIPFYTVGEQEDYYEGTLAETPKYVSATVAAGEVEITNSSELVDFVTPKVAQEGATITVKTQDTHTETLAEIPFYTADDVEDFYDGVLANPPKYVTVTKVDTYPVTFNMTNGTHGEISVLRTGETVVVAIAANEGYQLPTSTDVTVTGAHKNYSKAEGKITLSEVTGPVTVTIDCIPANSDN